MTVERIPRRPDPGIAPLTSGQLRLFFLDRYEPDSAAYVSPVALHLSGRLDEDALRAAFDRLVERQASLRTTIEAADPEPVQRIHPTVRVPWERIGLDAEAGGDEIGAIVRDRVRRPFDLERGPLVRAHLIRRSPTEHLLLLTWHHIVSDGWSRDVLLEELSELYAAAVEGRPPRLQELPVDYGDYAAWERARTDGARLTRQVEHWSEVLAGIESLELPTDRPRPPLQSLAGRRLRFELAPELVEGLRRYGAARGATLFMVLLAGWGTLLSRLTGQHRFGVGVPIAGRTRPEIEPLVGFFANTLVIPVSTADDPTFDVLVDRLRPVALDAYDHHDLPFEKLIEALAPERDLARSPVFQTLLVMQRRSPQSTVRGGLRWRFERVDGGTAKVDLTLDSFIADDVLRCELEYATDLFDDATARRWCGHLRRLLEAALADPARPVSRLEMLDRVERRRLVDDPNRTARPTPGPATVHERVLAQVRRTPDAVALVRGDRRWSYRRLWSQVEGVAARLQRAGVAPGDVVAVCGARSPELVAAMLGVMAAGAAYLPLDPRDPELRHVRAMADAGVRAVIAGEELDARFATAGVARIPIDRPGDDGAAVSWRPPEPDPRALAYVMFTSGSTGRPKGVAVGHRGVVDRLEHAGALFADSEIEAVLGSTSVCFDVSVLELFVPLSRGGRVVLVDDVTRIEQIPDGEAVTMAVSVPSAVSALVAAGRLPSTIRTLALLGELLPPALVDRIVRETSVARVVDLYGPTEDTICSTWAERTAGGPPTIGRPLPNSRAYVVDRHLEPVPVGVRGELLLGGVGVARGYLGLPELTEERFVRDPFGDPGDRLYRTGDAARWRPDGTLELLGRFDRQLKLRGYRIEPGEVEAVLGGHPGIARAVVAATAATGGERALVAWVVPADGGRPDPEGWRAHAAARLPRQMVPSQFVPLERLPLTRSGKVDLAALPRPALDPPRPTAAAPRDALERAVAEAFREVLAVDRVGRGDDFFRLGGHSLAALRLASRLAAVVGSEVPVVRVFEHPTIAGLAGALRPERADGG